jgi:hypothetical protein
VATLGYDCNQRKRLSAYPACAGMLGSGKPAPISWDVHKNVLACFGNQRTFELFVGVLYDAVAPCYMNIPRPQCRVEFVKSVPNSAE